MKVLYLADPNSNHDVNWMSFFSSTNTIETYLVCRTHQYESFFRSHADDFLLKNYNIHIKGSISDFSLKKIGRTIRDLRTLKKLIINYKIEIVHILYAEPNALWAMVKEYLNVPIIITMRGTDILVTITNHFKKRSIINFIISNMYKYAFQKANIVTGTSIQQLKQLATLTGRKKNVELIHSGIDLHEIENANIELPTQLIEKKFILFPRFIKPIYQHEFCLQAIDRLPVAIKRNFMMVFVGKHSGDNIYQAELESMMKKMTDVHFAFLPRVDRTTIINLYKKAALVVMTPKSDGTSVSAMEAIACRSKVIVGPLDYDNDVIGDWVTKLKKWDVMELAGVIENLITNSPDHPNLELFYSRVDRKKEMTKLLQSYKRISNCETSR